MKIALTRKVQKPLRGTPGSAGMDIFIPEFTDDYIRAVGNLNSDAQSMGYIDQPNNGMLIRPNGRFQIPMGIRIEFDAGYMLVAYNKSGVSWENRVSLLAQIIDSDYQGEIFITLHNFSAFPTVLRPGQKLCQLILLPTPSYDIEFIDNNDIHLSPTQRGDGAMGSTGK